MSDIFRTDKTDRGAEAISTPLEEMPGGRGAKGAAAEVLWQARWPGDWDAGEDAAYCHVCGALSKS
ncbi:hypothetical protein H9X83_03825 [Anaerotignum lactatifermentans]|uniref:Uncharacterized protein n=1 Tax=Anaerotignum lactatifermentans TaxID=160404 RepID=A0ABS2G8C9_9FIRM|nr:hypothetical protein [Anaerotignum lactatifermentans]